MKRLHISSLLAGLVLAIVLLQPITLAVAQTTDNGVRYTSSPLPINLSTKPGTTVTTDLWIKNSGSQPEVYKVGLLKFSASGTDGKPKLAPRSEGDDYFDWVSFSPSQFPIEVNEQKTVKMTINVPKSAAFGYYYAVTFGRADVAEPEAQQTALVGSTANLVLLDVDVPGAKRDIVLSSFDSNRSWYEYLPASFTVKFQNKGNVHAAPFGNIYVTRAGSTDQIGSLSVNSNKGNILPNSERDFTAFWDQGFPVFKDKEAYGKVVLDSAGKPEQQLQWKFAEAENFRIGKYTAHLVAAYNDGQRDVPLESSVDFWIIPWKMLLIVVIVSALILVGVFSIARGVWRRFHRSSDELY